MMIRFINLIAGRLIILVLIASLAPEPAIADDGNQNLAHSIRPSSSAAVGPIGTVNSFSPIRINGRTAANQQLIWDGDLVETLTGMAANVIIDSVGQIALTGETTMRVSTKQAGPGDPASNRLMIVSLIKGDMSVKLDRRASGYIEACESAFTASEGASFRVIIREGRPDIDVKAGTVTAAQVQSGSEYTAELKSIKIDKNGRPIGKGPDKLTMPKNATRLMAFLATLKKTGSRTRGLQIVLTGYSPSVFQTGGDEQPLQNAEIEFTLTNPIGTLDGLDRVTARTNNLGVATVLFKAGPVKGDANLVATLVQYNVRKEVAIKVGAKSRIWRPRNLLIIAAGVIAGAVIISHPKKEVEKIPPPIIIP